MKKHLIKSVKENSIAYELGIEEGDTLLAIDGFSPKDVFDYQMYCENDYIVVEIEKKDGEIWEFEIEKDEDEDLGLEFDSGMMDDYQSCRNKCIFCFIDQMPKGMRETLYFKDDDSRLSFLQGNYVTLTNMDDDDINRIIRYNLAPINISIHTMNPELRCKMLNNRFAGEKLKYLDVLTDAGIEINGQIVCCKGVNDLDELDYSISQIEKYIPYMKSMSIVPSGLTKFREGLYPLKLFNKEDAIANIEIIEKWQKHFKKKYGSFVVQASDEWYIMAEKEIPKAERYEGYIQLENGVGMTRLFIDEVKEKLDSIEGDDREFSVSTFSGKLIHKFVDDACHDIMKKFPNVKIHNYLIENDFFGRTITVTGLLVGKDIINQLKDKELGQRLVIPCTTLKSGEKIFLDDITVDDLENILQIPTVIVKSSGGDFVESMINPDYKGLDYSTSNRYEQ